MKNQFEVIERTIELLQTIDEGLCYIQDQINNKKYVESINMIQDVLDGIESIQNATKPIFNEETRVDLDFLASNLNIYLNAFLSNYTQNNMDKLEVSIKGIIVNYRLWKEEIEKELRLLTLS